MCSRTAHPDQREGRIFPQHPSGLVRAPRAPRGYHLLTPIRKDARALRDSPHSRGREDLGWVLTGTTEVRQMLATGDHSITGAQRLFGKMREGPQNVITNGRGLRYFRHDLQRYELR